MKPLFIPGAGLFISADVAADLRHGARRDLAAAQRRQEHVSPDTVAAVELMETIGAAYAQHRLGEVSAEVSPVDPQRCAPIQWTAMTVPAAAHELQVSQQFVRRLLARQTLHGEQQADRSWRVCAESVTARREGAKCPCHH